ncbi:MAG: RelA/SpoT domain-containing protein [Phycisphaeraceae bacterium]|nr:RelA/SpoT domain-containing protein [Phycisphaeraceae bacterium]
MDYPPVPEESKGRIDAVGKLLASDTEYIGGIEYARQLVSQWRGAHLFPLRAIADDLNHRLARLGIEAIVSLRLKRLFRIRDKLRQFDEMRLTRMQDVGALRAVVSGVADVRRLEQDYIFNPSTPCSDIVRVDDYIASPKPSGYRSLHIVFRYHDKVPSRYDGMRIELQVRTSSQHLWASAVEVTGLWTGSQLKYDEGDPAWGEFFQFAAEAIARREGCDRSAKFSGDDDSVILDKLRNAERSVGAIDRLRSPLCTVSDAHVNVDTDHARGKEIVLLELSMEPLDLRSTIYKEEEYTQALQAYADAEQRQTLAEDNTSVVLVNVNSVISLRDAYPTFFLDTSRYADLIDNIMNTDW